jgi:hypothetical protein
MWSQTSGKSSFESSFERLCKRNVNSLQWSVSSFLYRAPSSSNLFVRNWTMDEQIPQFHTFPKLRPNHTTLRPIVFHYPNNTCCKKLQAARRLVRLCIVQHIDLFTKTQNSQNW